MARPTDPTFGADFDATAFRSAIFSASQMGNPNKVDEALLFFFEGTADYAVTDSTGLPWDLHAPKTSPTDGTVEVSAVGAVDYVDQASDGTRLGDFDTPRAVITMLDLEYVKVHGATGVRLGGDMYDVRYVTVGALFDVDVYTVNCEARGES